MASRFTKTRSFNCLQVTQGTHQFAIFVAKASKLKNLLDVSKRQEDQDKGYQRHFSKSRVRAIAQYIDAGNSIPLSILVSFDEGHFTDSKLVVPMKRSVGWIIDGQHRYLGAIESSKDIELPVIAFLKLSEDEQIHQFVTINREAKGVPTSLYYDLLPRLKINKSSAELSKERAADLAHLLRRNEDSPFFNRIVVTTSPKRGEISLNNFVRKVGPLVFEDKGILAIYSEHEQSGIIDNYYKGLRAVFPREFERMNSKFFQTLGFGALMNALPTFYSTCLAFYTGFTVADVTKAFKEIDHFDFGAWSNYGTGSAAENQAGEDLKAELDAAFKTKGRDTQRVRL